MGYGPGNVLGINKDNVEPLMNLPWNAFSMLEQVFTAGGGFSLLQIVKVAVGTVPVAVVMVIIGEAGLVSIGLLPDGTQKLIGLLKLLLLDSTKLLHE